MAGKAGGTGPEADADGASFADLVQAKYRAGKTGDDGDSAEARRIEQAFIARFGQIVQSRFGEDKPCGVALTDHDVEGHSLLESPGLFKRFLNLFSRRGRRERLWWWVIRTKAVHLHLAFPELGQATVEVVRLMSKCEKQAVYARRFLNGKDLRYFLTLLYLPADALVSLTKHQAARQPGMGIRWLRPNKKAASRGPDDDPLTQAVQEQLDLADEYYQYFTQRTARLAYFRGIAIATAALVALVISLYVFHGSTKAPTALLWSILAGALGAVASVLSSATFGRIILDRAQGGAWNSFLGAFRPLIGSLFGAAFFALVSAGYLPIKVPGGDGRLALYASIAFLAGFSHRWAQDTLQAAERRIPGPPSPAQGTTEQAAAPVKAVP